MMNIYENNPLAIAAMTFGTFALKPQISKNPVGSSVARYLISGWIRDKLITTNLKLKSTNN